MQIRNKPDGENTMPVTEMISIDPLALVRFGLRAPNDPRIRNTITVIDRMLKTETPNGPCWYRYRNDGYGEKEDGRPYDGTGIGRPWPLLTGERAHYEIAAGNVNTGRDLLHAMERFSNNGLFSEQIWDQEDITGPELFHGCHTGSAMPLVWAHAEHLKLICSIRDKAVFDMPRAVQKRYVRDKVTSDLVIWRQELPVAMLPKAKTLRIETHMATMIQWTTNSWQDVKTNQTADTGLGIHYVDLQTRTLQPGEVRFKLLTSEHHEEAGTEYFIQII
jgi:glucoamylase